jgi:4-hydroxy-3-polyprenylbenzoate decarboxylase
MTTTSPEETPKSSAQSFRRLIQELQDENGLVVIKSEVDLHLELAAIVRNVYETEDKAPLFNNVKDRQENGLFRILGAPVGASKIPGKRVTRIAKSLGLPSHVSDQEIIHKIHETKRLPKVPPKEVLQALWRRTRFKERTSTVLLFQQLSYITMTVEGFYRPLACTLSEVLMDLR